MPFEASSGRILITNGTGGTVLDTDDATMRVADYKQGSTTLPRISMPVGSLVAPTTGINTTVDLGAVASGSTVLGGSWRISNAEGLTIGEIRYLADEVPVLRWYRRRHLYAPRLQQDPDDWFPAGGVNMLDMYLFLFSINPFTIQTSGSTVPEVGRLWHSIQFVIDGGRLKLIRRGGNVAHEYVFLTFGSFPTQDRYAYAFDCAALTIDYRIWLGAFT